VLLNGHGKKEERMHVSKPEHAELQRMCPLSALRAIDLGMIETCLPWRCNVWVHNALQTEEEAKTLGSAQRATTAHKLGGGCFATGKGSLLLVQEERAPYLRS
jgi:hypothetical protein